MNSNVRIARELVRIATELSGGPLPKPDSIVEEDSVSSVIEETLPGAHDSDEYYLYEGDEYWDYIEPELSEGDFSDNDAYEFLVDHDSNGKPIFRCVFGVTIEHYNEHWSGRHDDYEPSYDTGAFANADEIAVFACIVDKYDGDTLHYYNVTDAISDAAFSGIESRIKKINYNNGHVELPPQGTGHLDDDF